MDTNQENGVSLDDVSELLDEAPEQIEEGEVAEEEGLPDEGEQPEPEAEDDGELVEIEIKGKTYRIPKEVESQRLMHKDYTQKTQAAAEHLRAVKEREHVLEQREQALGASFEKAVAFRQVQDQLAKFEAIDWNQLVDADPVQAQKLTIAYQQLQREAQAKYAELQQTQAQVQQLTEHQRQQMLAQAEQDLRARLPDFGPQTAEQIRKTAQEHYGLKAEELDGLIDARHVHILHDAMKWRELQAKQPEALRKVAQAAPAIKPQAAQPKPRTNQAAYDRLKKNGRVEDLAALL
jgi:Asp-tRNA(Asn)/Glu-tRNA(Gln) amidotransferase A subunit family amidase